VADDDPFIVLTETKFICRHPQYKIDKTQENRKLSPDEITVWGGANGKWSKRFSSANGAKTEQTVRGGRVFGIISHHSRSPSVRANSRANSSRLQTEQKQTKHKPLFPFQAAPPQRFTAALGRFGVCVFITAGPITKLFAGGEEESGGHVL